jgi:hypothetical protein
MAMLSEEELSRPATIGDWSAKDLLSHVTFWEELAIEAADACRTGCRPVVEGIFDGGSEALDAAHAENQRRTADLATEEVRGRFEFPRPPRSHRIQPWLTTSLRSGLLETAPAHGIPAAGGVNPRAGGAVAVLAEVPL